MFHNIPGVPRAKMERFAIILKTFDVELRTSGAMYGVETPNPSSYASSNPGNRYNIISSTKNYCSWAHGACSQNC
jgi:hypothetical protein